MTKIYSSAVLGMGAFGVALTKLVSANCQTVWFWGRDKAVSEHIAKTRRHPHRLPQVTMAKHVFATTNMAEALGNADYIILAVPMVALGSVLAHAKQYMKPHAYVVSTAKGIEENTLYLPYDVVKNSLPPEAAHRTCYLSGPSFAIEVAMDLPTALTVASFDKAAAKTVQDTISTPSCRLYRTDDVIGVTVGGALKNVVAIAAGACSGLGLGRNALAALITRGLAEMARLARALQGRASTLSGLAGCGDLILSCTDDMSRNHRLGTLIADGYSLDDALIQIGSVVEGAKTAKAIPMLEKIHGIELPICRGVYQVLYEGLPAKMVISTLLNRTLKEENPNRLP